MSAHYPINILGNPDQDDYLIVSPNERRNQVKIFIRKEVAISAYVIDENEKKGVEFSTVLLGINQTHDLLIFDTAPSDNINILATKGSKLYCATSVNDVPVEFVLNTPCQATLAGKSIFVTQLPDVLVRVQRREFFRVTIPSSMAASCYIRTDEQRIRVEVTDISIGGLSIVIDGELPLEFELYEVYERCEVQLSLDESFMVNLEVRNHINKKNKKNKKITQIGFAYKNASGAIQSQVQRFIFNIESKRLRTR